MKTTALTRQFKATLTELGDSLSCIGQDLIRSGKLVVKLLDEREDAFEIILGSITGVTLSFLETLERIGRGELDPLLLTDHSPAALRALRQALPMEQQEQLTSKTVAVVVADNSHGTYTVMKRMQEIKPREAVRLIRNGKIQTPDQQRGIIEAQVAAKAVRALRYSVEGGVVVFNDRTPYKWAELQAICDKIKPTALEIQESVKTRQIVRAQDPCA